MYASKPLYIVGLGPGASDLLSGQAIKALEISTCIVGYGLYLDLVPFDLKKDKKLIQSGMGGEKKRCLAAIHCAMEGQTTSLVCSGDPGIYALACLVIELLEKENLLNQFPLEIIPGIPALSAAAARLGAPISHDFACISLSDLLTPWEIIEKRLRFALEADFVCVLYNPRSQGRPDYLSRAIDLARKWRKGDCPIALAKNVYREGEQTELYTLQNFKAECADMRSLIIIGNNESRCVGKYMLTPRGYFSENKSSNSS